MNNMHITAKKLQILAAVIFLTMPINIFANSQSQDFAAASAILAQTAKLNGYDKVIFTTSLLLNTPYKLFPLGEGETATFANKPTHNLSVFDCLTFVETTLALALSQNNQKFLTTLDDLRYHSQKYNFANRNHFMSTEWNYYNQKKGYIRDITTKIYNERHNPIYKTTQTVINKPAWMEFLAYHPKIIAKYTDKNEHYATIKNTLLAYAKQSQPQIATTAYIEASSLIESGGNINAIIYQQLPKIFIVEIVRKHWGLASKIGTELDISHLGFGIKTKHGLILRHASEMVGAVVDTSLAEYLASQAKQKSFAGINIEAINIL
jgi:hypothetical protein